MQVPDSDPSSRRLLVAAVFAGVVTATGSVASTWGRLVVTNRSLERAGATLPSLATGWALAAVASVPFLLAVLVVVVSPTRRAVAGGAVLVYVIDLVLTTGRALLSGVPARIGLPVLAAPLARVVSLLAVATAVWLAYHGGYDTVVSIAGSVTGHPLFAVVADWRIGPALPLQRGLVAAGLAALVGAGGLVVAGGLWDVLGVVARFGSVDGPPAVVTTDWVWSVGIPLRRFPRRWLFEASLLLAILSVTGPRLRRRDVLTGLAVIFGVQSAVHLLPMVLPPFEPVYLFGAPGPILTPLSDAVLLVGIATAVWLGVRDGPKPLRYLARGWPDAD
jgi:hypothetical protein